MKKYKICPSCKTKNEPVLFECINCEADLTGVKITDEESEKMNEENNTSKQQPTLKMVRICECGTKNAPNARKCISCKEDISDIIPVADTDEQPEQSLPVFVLSSIDGRFAYKVISDKTVIGRENIMSEYLCSKSYVSRTHAQLTLESDSIYIENMSKTNFTYVNNIKISEKTKLQDGDEIGLGGNNSNGSRQEQAAYFLVRIE